MERDRRQTRTRLHAHRLKVEQRADKVEEEEGGEGEQLEDAVGAIDGGDDMRTRLLMADGSRVFATESFCGQVRQLLPNVHRVIRGRAGARTER